jgi:hypothetical protein
MSTSPQQTEKPEKSFDCVDMKQRIQDELARSQAGQTREALNSAAERRMAADPHLRRFLATAQAIPPTGRKAG